MAHLRESGVPFYQRGGRGDTYPRPIAAPAEELVSTYESLPMHNYRSEVMQAAQRREWARLQRLVAHLIEDAGFTAHDLDCTLALHNTALSAELVGVSEQLLALGCDPYFPDVNGDTPCHYCVRGCNLKFLRTLHATCGNGIFGVLNNQLSNLMLTAAAEAPDERAYEVLNILEWLHLSGMSLESADYWGKTPLMYACQRGSLTLVQWCLSRGADLARRDYSGRTVLMIACHSGDEEVVRLICEKGAINLLQCESNDDGESNTAVKLSWSKGHFFLSVLLRQWYIQRKLFGCMRIFKNSYAWYYWSLTVFNFVIFSCLASSLVDAEYGFWRRSVTFVIFFFCTQIFWSMAFGSNPGYVKDTVIPDQSHRCSLNLRADLAQRPVLGTRFSGSVAKLQILERESACTGADLITLNRAYGHLRGYGGRMPPEIAKKYEICNQRLQKTRDKMLALLERVAQERQIACPKNYVTQVMDGTPRKVCLTCRIVKPFRAHHCSDCGHCVRRFDHHCIWIDNCVGEGNQRSFLIFLFCLTCTIICFWILVGTYYSHELNKKDAYSLDLLAQPLFYIAFFNSLLNLLWAGFVGYLFGRTFKSMCTNITFYEYLKKPSHIQKRFRGKVHGCCWDTTDLTPSKILRNIYSYCSLNNSNDASDYLEADSGPQTASNVQMPLLDRVPGTSSPSKRNLWQYSHR